MGGSQIRILLADDQSLIREGLRYILNSQEDMTVVAEADDGNQATDGTVKTHVHHILQKLSVDDRTQAVVLAIRSGLVDR